MTVDIARDEDAIDDYFSGLGKGDRITSYDIFKARIGFELSEGQSVAKVIEHFWQASRAASMISSINTHFSSHPTTKAANKFMSRKLGKIYELFLSAQDEVTVEDLERLMAFHVRLQTVPTAEFMGTWIQKALSQIDHLTDAWFKSNFDHCTKLGLYPTDELMTAWWEKTEGRIEDFEISDQFRILYKMATFDFLRTQDWVTQYADVSSPCKAIADHVFERIECDADRLFPALINNQVFFAGLWFGKDFVKHIPVAGDDVQQSSVFENQVAGLMSATKIKVHRSGILVPVTGHKIDLKLIHEGQIFGCEIDGISHFNRVSGATPEQNSVVYNASTRFHSFLTAQYMTGMNIIRVPYFLCDADNQKTPWEKTLSRISRKGEPAVYAWHGGSIARNMGTEKNAHLFRGCDL